MHYFKGKHARNYVIPGLRFLLFHLSHVIAPGLDSVE